MPAQQVEQVTAVDLSKFERNQESTQLQEPPSTSPEQEDLKQQFLDAMGNAKSGISDKIEMIEKSFKNDTLSPANLLKVQYELAQVTLQQELISKGVTKTTQNIDTLIKAQ